MTCVYPSPPLIDPGYGLYIHIPFCVRKCLYCDFYSLPTGKGPIARRLEGMEADDQGVFLAALDRELSGLPVGFAPVTVFIGGGTPTELSTDDFRRLFDLIRARVDLSQVTEWTCESNPGTLTREKIGIMLGAGVNRVSLGVQSFNPANLEFLGRIHSADEAAAGYRMLREEGCSNINLDLIYGIPGSTLDRLEHDLETLISLRPDHAACYCLIFEDGTPLADLQRKGFVKEVDDDTELEQYERVRNRLGQAGYRQYEISNFSLPGRESVHNRLYWGPGEYIGIGPSAHSHWQGQRFGNIRNLSDYCERLLNGGNAEAFREALDAPARMREAVVMGLRRREGISRESYRRHFSHDILSDLDDTIRWLCEEGLLEWDDERLKLTDRGLFVSDGVFAELI